MSDGGKSRFFARYALPLGLILVLGGATVYYFYWHWHPFTQDAFLFADTRPVSPLVEGYITEIYVKNNQFVKKGDPLFRTFSPPYTLKCRQLRHSVEETEAAILALDERIEGAKSRILGLEAVLANAKYLSGRAEEMYRKAAVSQEYAEERRRALESSEEAVRTAVHEMRALEHSRTAAAASLKRLKAELELAEIYESQTLVTALSDGYVTNLSISPGGYYRPGDVLFGFVKSDVWFVQANFKESELSELKKGLAARIWLWQYPGREFHGVVEEVGFGSERRRASPVTGLPEVEKENEWFLLPQRYPVQIRIQDPPSDLVFHVGASAYVELDSQARPIRQFFWQLFLCD